MTQWLKVSTAVTVKLGPFVDDTDGKTAETELTISQGDIRLSKNGGDIAQTNNAAGATHDELGYYDVPLDTTDTGTLGRLDVMVSKSGALPVWQRFMVVPANVWDSMFGADRLAVDAEEIGADVITAAAVAADAISEIQAGLATAGAGATPYTITIDNGSDPVDGAAVWVTTDAAGTHVVASGTTNALGQVTFMLDAGDYYAWSQQAGTNFTNPTTFTVS